MPKKEGTFNRKMPRNKSCGCLVGAAVINFEIERRKNLLRLEEINKKLKRPNDAKKIAKLREEKSSLLKALKNAHTNKQEMKSRFDDYVKKSGYAPPKPLQEGLRTLVSKPLKEGFGTQVTKFKSKKI